MKTMVAVLTLSLFVVGCVSQSPTRGSVVLGQFQEPAPGVGMPFADFRLVDQNGNERFFREELADFTLVSFTRCDGDAHAQATERIVDLTREFRNTRHVRVAGIDVHRGCDRAETCHVALANAELGSLCDGSGTMHQRFGAGRDDWVYVIGPDRRIVLSSPIDQIDDLREPLSSAVARYAATRNRPRSMTSSLTRR